MATPLPGTACERFSVSTQSRPRKLPETLSGPVSSPSSLAVQVTGSIGDQRGDFGVPLGEVEGEGDGDPHLRSMREVEDYHVHAADGPIGHVEDFLVDPEGWSVRYFLVDTRNWWSGKRVLVSPQWIDRVDWPLREVHATVTRERIKACPEFDEAMTLDRGFEERLFRHYEKLPYWA